MDESLVILEAKNMYHIYESLSLEGNVVALRGLNVRIKEGEAVAVIGPSGSGKSTLLKCLGGLMKPSSGSVKIENKQIDFNDSNKNDTIRANKIGIIYQQDNLLPDFTALENICLASLAAGNNKDLSISKAKILLRKIGLINRLNHYPSELSGGEKQRVSIARAVINNPQIILADEPTGSLDMETAKGIFQLLKNQINSNRLIIFATHNRFFANKSDCLLEMVDGNIKTING